MSADKNKEKLRSILTCKTTEELEELLALDFFEQEDAVPNMDYIMTILEVIDEREGNTEEKRAKTEVAWREFQEYYQLRMQEEALKASVDRKSRKFSTFRRGFCSEKGLLCRSWILLVSSRK